MFITRTSLYMYVLITFIASTVRNDYRINDIGDSICISIMLYNTIRFVQTILVIDTFKRALNTKYKYFIHITHYYSRLIVACICMINIFLVLFSYIRHSDVMKFLFWFCVVTAMRIVITETVKIITILYKVEIIGKGDT